MVDRWNPLTIRGSGHRAGCGGPQVRSRVGREAPPFLLPESFPPATSDIVERPGTNPIPVLVVDGASATCIPLTDHLRHRGFRCEIQGTSRGALAHLSRATSDRWPRLLLMHFPPIDADGLEFLAHVRQQHPSLPVICYADLNLINGIIFDQAERMHVRFLSLPFDTSRLDASLTASLEDGRRKSRDEQPFFSTSRHVRGTTTRYDNRVHTDSGSPRSDCGSPRSDCGSPRSDTGSQHRADTRAETAVPPDASASTPPPVAPVASSTTRSIRSNTATGTIRRSVDTGVVRRPEAAGAETINSNTTSRIRRSVTGRVENPAAQPERALSESGNHRRVICAACECNFVVAHRPDAFVIPCIQCGTLNRVEPLR